MNIEPSSQPAPPRRARRHKRSGPKTSWPVGFDKEELVLIKKLVAKTNNLMSVSSVARSSVRYAVPLMLDGTIPFKGDLKVTSSAPANP